MANFRDIKENFAVDQLLGLYVKVNNKTKVYQYFDGYGKAIEWQGWVLQPGTIAGKLYSWIDGSEFGQYGIEDNIDGIYLMMEATENTNWKYYYIKVEPGNINWAYTRDQLDAQRKANMNFYERWFDDLETQVVEAYQSYSDAIDQKINTAKKVLTGVLIGSVVFGGAWLYWNSYGKYDLLLKKGAKYFKNI